MNFRGLHFNLYLFGCLQCACIDPNNLGDQPCELPEYKGDGNCDDENNNKGCGYDGGDCCYKTVKGGKVEKKYCKEVGWCQVVLDCEAV